MPNIPQVKVFLDDEQHALIRLAAAVQRVSMARFARVAFRELPHAAGRLGMNPVELGLFGDVPPLSPFARGQNLLSLGVCFPEPGHGCSHFCRWLLTPFS